MSGLELVGRWRRIGALDGAGGVRAGAQPYFGPRPSGWLRAGDIMCDGVIPLGEALRPLGLSRASTRA